MYLCVYLYFITALPQFGSVPGAIQNTAGSGLLHHNGDLIALVTAKEKHSKLA